MKSVFGWKIFSKCIVSNQSETLCKRIRMHLGEKCTLQFEFLQLVATSRESFYRHEKYSKEWMGKKCTTIPG